MDPETMTTPALVREFAACRVRGAIIDGRDKAAALDNNRRLTAVVEELRTRGILD